jgi:hypothetical protein
MHVLYGILFSFSPGQKALPIGTRESQVTTQAFIAGSARILLRESEPPPPPRRLGFALGNTQAKALSGRSLTDNRKEASKRLRFSQDSRELAFQFSVLSGEVQ